MANPGYRRALQALAGVLMTTGAAGWTLTTLEEPGAVVFLSESTAKAVATVFIQAGQSASLAPSRTYELEFLVKPAKGSRQGFRLAEAGGSRGFAFTLLAVRDPSPPFATLYGFQISDPLALEVLKLEGLARISLP